VIDLLHNTLKDLKPGEEILCLEKTWTHAHKGLFERFMEFKKANPTMRFTMYAQSKIVTIKRLR
jgi:hypothetical protein